MTRRARIVIDIPLPAGDVPDLATPQAQALLQGDPEVLEAIKKSMGLPQGSKVKFEIMEE